MFRTEADAGDDKNPDGTPSSTNFIPKTLSTHDFLLRDSSHKRRFMLDYLGQGGDFTSLKNDKGENNSFNKSNDRIPLTKEIDWLSTSRENALIHHGMQYQHYPSNIKDKPILAKYISVK